MSDPDTSGELEPDRRDYVALALKSALGAVPFAGSLLAEIASVIIPNQRIERIAKFAGELESQLRSLEAKLVLSRLDNENFTDLMEEGIRQAARSLSDDRRRYIANLISRSIDSPHISHIESKHLLRMLGEVNDIEIIRLISHLYDTYGSGEDYWQKHSQLLEPVHAHFGAPQSVLDRSTLQQSYDDHLVRLGLLQARYIMDHTTRLPQFDRHTGEQKVQSYELAPLGRLLIREIGVPEPADRTA